METAAVARLKSQLSHYLREVVVTERGVPITRLVPVGRGDPGLEDLRDLERQGLVHGGTGRVPKGFWRLPRVRDARASVRRAVSTERDERD